jgi:hypothetical protein
MAPRGTIESTESSLPGTVDWHDPYLTSLLAIESLFDRNMPQNAILGLEFNAISAPKRDIVSCLQRGRDVLVGNSDRTQGLDWIGLPSSSMSKKLVA